MIKIEIKMILYEIFRYYMILKSFFGLIWYNCLFLALSTKFMLIYLCIFFVNKMENDILVKKIFLRFSNFQLKNTSIYQI